MPICAARAADGGPIVLALALSLAALGTGCSCEGCGADDVLAELVESEGRVQRDFAASVGAWEGADLGAQFRLGDGLRTSAGTSAELDLEGARLSVEPSTEIRFARGGASGAARLDVAAGAATLESAGEEARIATSLGLAVLEPGARVRLEARSEGARLSVELGHAVLEDAAGTRTLRAGDAVDEGATARSAAPGDPPPERAVTAPAVAESGETEPPAAGALDVTSLGSVQQREGERWVELAGGAHRMRAGTRIRMNEDARVTVRRGADRVDLSDRGEHLVGAGGGALVETLSGRARIVAREATVSVRVPGGVIIAMASAGETQGDVAVEADGTRVSAERGRVLVRQRGDESVLEAGQSAHIARASNTAASTSGEVAANDEELARFDLSLRAGEDSVVHAPRPPIVVRFELGDACPEGGIVELARRRAATHRLSAGRHPYRVRCADGRGAEGGRIVVLRDSGQVRLPRTPPMSIIDADGRRYTVLYQNQLPTIRVRWPGAPDRGPYTLRFVGGSEPPLRQPQPSFQLESGSLREGNHRLVVEAADRRSPETSLAIRFDNASPAASVREPADQSFAPGEPVHVAGVALPDWSVAVAGRAIVLDAQQRFDLTVSAPTDRALSIRVSHPRRGAHYYLRRPRGAP